VGVTAPAIVAGPSGFAYREWIPAFYPPGTKTKDLLAAYAARLPAVELNHTYYRMPTEAAARGWRAQVAAGFRFAVKAPMFLTVRKAAFDPAPVVAELQAALAPLGEALGCVFLQFPAHVVADAGRLDGLLAAMPRDWRCACEFEHASWSSPATTALLARHGATRVVRDDDDAPAGDGAIEAAFGWQYVRLRRSAYRDDELAAWRRRIADASRAPSFVFFRHEETARGARFALQFVALAPDAQPARASKRAPR